MVGTTKDQAAISVRTARVGFLLGWAQGTDVGIGPFINDMPVVGIYHRESGCFHMRTSGLDGPHLRFSAATALPTGAVKPCAITQGSTCSLISPSEGLPDL